MNQNQAASSDKKALFVGGDKKAAEKKEDASIQETPKKKPEFPGARTGHLTK